MNNILITFSLYLLYFINFIFKLVAYIINLERLVANKENNYTRKSRKLVAEEECDCTLRAYISNSN